MNNLQQKFSKHIVIVVILVIFLGFFSRTYRLESNPAGFFCDEASIGYNAYSILHTGKDEYGMFLPVFFRSFGDYRHPIAVYTDVLFVSLFGLTEFSERLQAVFFGMVLIVFLYFLGKEVKSNKLGAWMAFCGAITPWLLHYSRTGFEFSSYACFFVVFLYFLVRAARQPKFIILFFVFLGLTIYTYQPAKLMVFLFLLGSLAIYRKNFTQFRRYTIYGLGLFSIISIPLLTSFLSGSAFARFNQVSVFNTHASLQTTLSLMANNYFSQLSPTFFLNGEKTLISRHFTQGLIPFLPITLPFIVLGIITILISIKEKFFQLLLFILVIYPIPAMLVAEGPFTARTIIGAPLFVMLMAIGVYQVCHHERPVVVERTLVGLVTFVFLVNFWFFLHFYFVIYPSYSAGFWGWQYGAKDIVHYFASQEKNYDDEIMAPEFNAPEIFFKFYAPGNCTKCQIGLPDQLYSPQKRQLFAVTPTYLQQNSQWKLNVLKTIYYPNHAVAFLIGEIVQ